MTYAYAIDHKDRYFEAEVTAKVNNKQVTRNYPMVMGATDATAQFLYDVGHYDHEDGTITHYPKVTILHTILKPMSTADEF